MADIEKVIKGLECCRIDENRHINCADCPYYTDDDKGQMLCSNEINNDAIELLKEKQPPKGHWINTTIRGSLAHVCSVCCLESGTLYDYAFCPFCGADMRGEQE